MAAETPRIDYIPQKPYFTELHFNKFDYFGFDLNYDKLLLDLRERFG